MKYTVVIVAISVGLIWGCQAKPTSNSEKESAMTHEMNHKLDQDQAAKHGEQAIAYYTCPMESHKHISSVDPGSCPECGMKLVAVVEVSENDAEYYGCPMPEHSHVREHEQGRCPECGMNLKPYKLPDSDS